ncbi:MAG: hypothetical protein KAW17_00135 [Candidatus Eisenbacteria sp.]|nr:hypothetical protein [Candidatus Eisenbacteria bacterium]
MSLSTIILLFVVLFLVCCAIFWRNMHQQKRPRKRFKVGRARRKNIHPIYGSRISYTQIAREEHSSAPPPLNRGKSPPDTPTKTSS